MGQRGVVDSGETCSKRHDTGLATDRAGWL